MPYRRHTMDLCHGPILKNLVLYALPLIASGVLQLLYNAADLIVVARFAGGTALAAVGSTGSLVSLIINVFIGMSTGASVVVARYYGAEDREGVSRSVHTTIALSFISGVATLLIGLFFSPALLRLMDTPSDVIDQAVLYLRIYFLGMPATMLYNFGSAVLRSVGDSKRPLYILSLSGIVNVGLNLLLVINFHLDVAGVAIATTVSQYISAGFVLACLLKATDCYRFMWKKLRLHGEKLREILHYAIPAGLQSVVFALSNTLIQSSINSFGSAVMSGTAAAHNIDGFLYTAQNAVYQSSMAMMGQNVGARKADRLPKIFWYSLGLVTVVGITIGGFIIAFGEPLLSLYTSASSIESSIPAAEIIRHGMVRIYILCSTYFICGIMEVLVGALRALGASWVPMIVAITGVCGVRIVWILTAFRFWFHSLEGLFISYPLSWLFTAVIHFSCFLPLLKKTLAKLSEPAEEKN